ncbi:Alcohol dehydrogenase superfamily, zinc-type [Metarhizium rileyi]|uniref:Alcohol dehydrogenase superfamily, zinc-type n=1 Tax=Metarhizium rileyi (strain RCEF 4871) TaxID=1649241 RepID=A0A167D142_METRR|nr:Alcohol dehydrogenase superfamily, zinc-type [Metarhizium rileyi RCEF 4871]
MTCRLWTFSQRGPPSSVLSFTSGPTPTLPPPRISKAEQWIVIKVAYAGLNVGALFQMTLIPTLLRAKHCTPEMDLSGTVTDAWPDDDDDEENQSRLVKGDKVIAMIPAAHALATGTGALAEYIAIPAEYAVRKPDAVSFADAAGCLLTGMTAARMVKEANVGPGDRVLVNAASGGIGTMVVQMVRNAVGAEGYIVGVCSGKNAHLVRSLGADEVVDYTQHSDLAAYLGTAFSTPPFDAVVDTLGLHALYVHSPSYLVHGGVYSSVGIRPPSFGVCHFLRAVLQMKLNEWWPVSSWLGGVGRLWKGVSMMAPTPADREAIVAMLARREVRVVRDSVWPFVDADKAYEKLAGRHASGKILVRVDDGVGDDET